MLLPDTEVPFFYCSEDIFSVVKMLGMGEWNATYRGKVPLEQGERTFLSNQQRACLLSVAAAADIGNVRGHNQQRPLRTVFITRELFFFCHRSYCGCEFYRKAESGDNAVEGGNLGFCAASLYP